MRVESIRTLAGPNVYTHRPALLMLLDLEDLSERESREFEGLNERLLALLPGLSTHHCSKGYAGGFAERLREGTYFGHVVEHVALELMELAGVGVSHGKTRYAGRPGLYHVVVEYKAEQTTRFLLEAAVALVAAALAGEPFPLAERLNEARRIAARTELGPSTRAIVEAAERRGIPWARVGADSIVRLGWGRHRRFVQAATSDLTSAVAVEIAGDKELTKQLLEQAGIPVPRGRVARHEEEAVAALRELGGPVVVKPLDGRQGFGVSLNLTAEAEVARAFHLAREFSASVLVEELIEGRNYRVLVVAGRVVAASERAACHVTGDGRRTIAELIEEANRDPLRGDGHEKPLTKIKVDEIVRAHLAKMGWSLEHVPASGQAVSLRESINLSTGGTARDVTEEMHESVRRACERATRAVGLDICGVDLVAADIAAPFVRGKGAIIELNASPGLRMHQHPSEGLARDAGDCILRMLYPAGDGRIPVFSITGTNGKTTVTRMIAHVLSETGLNVGMTTTDGVWVGGELLVAGDTTGPHSARTVLFDPTVEAAVLETARGGIARRGLGYDWADVAVLTNIQPDHFGQDGIETLEDIVFIKSLVAERVREGGTLILNADDEHLARLVEHPRVSRVRKRVVYFSLREDHVLIRKHLDAGGTVFYMGGGWVVEAEGQERRRVLRAADVPATMGGTAEFQLANLLACVAACRAHGIPLERVAAALAGFYSTDLNPGRANLFRLPVGGHVMLDYGHNPEAFASICRMAARWEGVRVTGIVGVPGDRADELIEEAGRAAARGFSRLVVKEDKDLRGRAPGEVADLLCRAIRREAPGRECEVVLDESEALRRELARLGAGEVVVMFFDKLAPLLAVLEEHEAEPVNAIDGLVVREGEPQVMAAAASAAPSDQWAAPSVRQRRAAVFASRDKTAQDWQGYIWR